MAEKLDGKSKSILAEKKRKLAAIVPEAFSDGKVDFEKLKRALGDEMASGSERYRMEWAGKAGCFAELERQTTKTLTPMRKDSVDFDTTQNVFIEGENLEVLKVLQKSYYGQVKMIYIDPPYNTGNDFIYRDKFSQSEEDYLEEAGDVDESGNLARDFRKNSKEGGRYHSNWLTMMYPRLYLARNLLRDDGVIFVSIDDNEVHNLRMIMNEIFGEENFIGELIHQRAKGGGQAKQIVKGHDYILVYAKNTESGVVLRRAKVVQQDIVERNGKEYLRNDDVLRKTFGKYDKKLGDRRCFYEEIERYKGKEKKREIDERIKKGELVLEKNGKGVHIIVEYVPLDEASSKLYSIIKVLSEEGKYDMEELGILGFDYPKPALLIQQLIQAATLDTKNDSSTVLDFFAGSGTTAHSVMAQNAEDGGNRKYILVQLAEETSEDSEARKAGYKNIAEISRERIRRATKKLKQEKPNAKIDGGFKAFRLEPSNFKLWRMQEYDNAEELQKKLEDAIDMKKSGAEKESVLFELMLKTGISLASRRDDKGAYYRIQDGEILYVISLAEKLTKEIVEKILAEKPKVFIALDSSFGGNDTLKKNTELQSKDAKVEFKVV